MNPLLGRLEAYPFERLRALLAGVEPPPLSAIPLHIGEPRHPAPPFVLARLAESAAEGIDRYPPLSGLATLREAAAEWLCRRFSLAPEGIDSGTMLLPVAGTREALFSFALATVDPGARALVAMPNPCYQIYEGAAVLSGAEPLYLPCTPQTGYVPDLDAVGREQWNRCALLYLSTPGNPTGQVLSREYLAHALELAERHDFVVASDECYSEIYVDEALPPPGLLEVAQATGRTGFERCVVFHSLSKRSNVPGLRSGFVAGDRRLLSQYAKYRSYHGVALPIATQLASIAAWRDETHVRENRARYRDKLKDVVRILSSAFEPEMPPATFYLWLTVDGDDERFARELFRTSHVTVLPGRYMARAAGGVNPGAGRIRVSLVATESECIEAAERMVQFANAYAA